MAEIYAKRPHLPARTSYTAFSTTTGPTTLCSSARTLEGSGANFLSAVDAMGLEGMVSKKRTSRYCSDRMNAWLKTKTFEESDFVLMGSSVKRSGPPSHCSHARRTASLPTRAGRQSRSRRPTATASGDQLTGGRGNRRLCTQIARPAGWSRAFMCVPATSDPRRSSGTPLSKGRMTAFRAGKATRERPTMGGKQTLGGRPLRARFRLSAESQSFSQACRGFSPERSQILSIKQAACSPHRGHQAANLINLLRS
jgi:hypothetical protein